MNGGEKFMNTILKGFIVFSFLFTSFTQSQYQVKEPLIAGGAIIKSSGSGTNYEVSATAGQLVIDSVGNTQYSIYSGFWNQYPNIFTSLEFDDLLLPKVFDLKQNYPNPFNPVTTIEYSVPSSAFVTVKVFDVMGREIAVLVNGKKTTGNYIVQFDAKDINSGIYFYTLETNGFKETKKMLLVK